MKAGFWNKRRDRGAVKLATAKKKRERRICLTPRCRKQAREKRRYCNTCRCRMYDHPLRRLFRNLKAHAKARGKMFALSFEYFRTLAVKSGYDLLHGRGASDLHIDRIDNGKGYIPGNVQVLTASENSKKSCAERTGWKPAHLRGNG